MMRDMAGPVRKKAEVSAPRCIARIEWAAAGIRDEILQGGYYVIDKQGKYKKNAEGKRIFVKRVDMNKVKAFKEYAEIQMKMLRKVMPDAMNKQSEPSNVDDENLLRAIADRLPD